MRLIVNESSGDWAALLRRRLPSGVALIETRSFDEIWERLGDRPATIVAMELIPRHGEKLLAALRRLNREFPQALPVVLTERVSNDWDDAVREAGAIDFIPSPRQIDRLIDLVHFQSASAMHAGAAEDDKSPLEDRILAALPWND